MVRHAVRKKLIAATAEIYDNIQRVAESGDDGLPPVVRLNLPLNIIWDVWVRWRALERKHLPYPGGFLDQPEDMISDLLQLDSLYETFTRPKD